MIDWEKTNSQTTFRADSKDPRQKSTPRVSEHWGDQGIEIDQHETQMDEEEVKIWKYNNFMNFDPEVIQQISSIYNVAADEIYQKLQIEDSEMMNIYIRQSQVIKHKPEVLSYISPDNSSSNPRSSNKDSEAKSNALDGSVQNQNVKFNPLIENKFPDQILSPKYNVRTHGK